MENKNFSISGVSGVGKNFCLDKLREASFDFTEIHAGSEISQQIKIANNKELEQIINDSFDIIKLKIQAELGRVALSCHTVYTQNKKIYTNQNRIQHLELNKMIIIEADPEIILSRSLHDRNRNRNWEKLDEINQIQLLSTLVALEIAKSKNIMIKTFDNNDRVNIENIKDFLEH